MGGRFESEEIDLKRYELSLVKYQAEIARYQAERAASSADYATGLNAINLYAGMANKSLHLSNGAAILALLTFWGNVLVRGERAQGLDFGLALQFFVFGLIAAMGCSLLSYASQSLYVAGDNSQPTDDKKQEKRSSYIGSLSYYDCANFVRGGALSLAMISLYYFCSGAFEASENLALLSVM